MADNIFLNTDVVIDYLTDRSPFANFSTLLFDLNQSGIVKIYMSALSINNIYYVARKIVGESKTLDLIDKLIDDVEIVGTTKSEIRTALNAKFRDFEDGIQYATALTIENVKAIITRNHKDFRKSDVPIFSPEVYLKSVAN